MSTIAAPIDRPSIRTRTDPEPWPGFTVHPVVDDESPRLRLEQIDHRTFRLGSEIFYLGPTGVSGLDPKHDHRLRSVGPETLPSTDLASIPAPLRWWMNSYGTHTPAVLIHDRFIGDPVDGDPGRPPDVSEQVIDRYFRFMLSELEVPFFRRWLMWAAVACRTRLHAGVLRPIAMIVWFLLAIFGIYLFTRGLIDLDPRKMAIGASLPVLASPLWGQQAGAGLIIAYVGVPFLLPPTALAVPFLMAYACVESGGKCCSKLWMARRWLVDRKRQNPVVATEVTSTGFGTTGTA